MRAMPHVVPESCVLVFCGMTQHLTPHWQWQVKGDVQLREFSSVNDPDEVRRVR